MCECTTYLQGEATALTGQLPRDTGKHTLVVCPGLKSVIRSLLTFVNVASNISVSFYGRNISQLASENADFSRVLRAVVFARQYFHKEQTTVLNREIYIKTCKVKLQFYACDLEHSAAFFRTVGFPSGK